LHCLCFPFVAAALPTLLSSETTPVVAATTGEDAAAACCTAEEPSCAATAGTTGTQCCDDPTSFWIHVGMLGIAFPLAVLGLVSGYRCHGSAPGLVIGGAGVASLVLALVVQASLPGTGATFWLNILGSTLLVTAHLWNRGKCVCRARGADAAHSTQLAEGTC
jgi:hypothetical protein